MLTLGDGVYQGITLGHNEGFKLQTVGLKYEIQRIKKSSFILAHQVRVSPGLSHLKDWYLIYPVSTRGKNKRRARWRHCYVKVTSLCYITSHSFFILSIFRNTLTSKKKNPLFVWGWDRKICPSPSVSISPIMPKSDPRDTFFYPTRTLMIDSYTHSLPVVTFVIYW